MKYEALRKLLAKRVRQLREKKDWGQRKLESASGVAQKTISNLENSEISVNLDTLSAVAQAFGVEVWELLKPSVGEHVDAKIDAVRQTGPSGLRDLADDDATTQSIGITATEWSLLLAVGAELPITVDKGGYIQLLTTLRLICK